MTDSSSTRRIEALVVGVDDSPSARSAMAWAGAIRAATASTILAINALEPTFSEVPPETGQRLMDERRSVLDRAAGALGSLGANDLPAIEAIVRPGGPRDVVIEVAEAKGADLIVVGRGGDGARSPGLLHMESVTEHLFHHSSIPCAAIPAVATAPPGPVTIGVDGSVPSSSAVAWLAANVGALASEVIAVHVPRRTFLGRASSPDEAETAARLGRWIEPLRQTGIPIREVVTGETGEVAEQLLVTAHEYQSGLLVIGAKAIGDVLGGRAGGVAISALHRATTIPLIMVPPAGS